MLLLQQGLTASLKKRDAYKIIHKYGKAEKEDKQYQVIYEAITNFYERDQEADHVDVNILKRQIEETIRNPKHLKLLLDKIEDAATSNTSIENIQQLVIQTRLGLTKDKLAVALANRDEKQETLLTEELSILKAIKSLDELDSLGVEEFPVSEIDPLITETFDTKNIIKIWPKSLAKRIGGGLIKGNHIVIFATPNKGKSAMVITIACSIALSNWKILIIGNEEPAAQYWLRFIQAMSGRTKGEVLTDYHDSKEMALKRGLGNITIVTAAPGTKEQIEALIEKYKPDCLVIDQLRNINVGKTENKTNQLEAAATFARNMGNKHHLLVISVTQAGDSAANKAVLEMGDVDYSNTGIPAQADLMIGIGGTMEQEAAGIRIISLPKNKLTGEHDSWPVKLNQPLSRYQDL
jgi:replicative DNA helicase